jgi:hypothetical protein
MKVAAFILVASIWVAACAPVTALDDPDIVLVRTRWVSETVVGCRPPPNDGREYVMVDACWRVKLKVLYPLIGTTDQDYVYAGRFGAERRIDSDTKADEVFVLEKRTSSGFVTLEWSDAMDGLCVDNDIAKTVSSGTLEKINYWRKRYPCH